MRIYFTLIAILGILTLPTRGAVTFTGNNSLQPTFNRASSFSSLSTVGTAVRYTIQPFTVGAIGQYIVEVNLDPANGFTQGDAYIFVYANEFNPTIPLNNLIAGDDDFSGSYTVFPPLGGPSSVSNGLYGARIALGDTSNYGGASTGLNLSDSNIYYLVIAGFDNSNGGTFQAAIGGAGAVNLVPEPSGYLLLATSISMLLTRRKRTYPAF